MAIMYPAKVNSPATTLNGGIDAAVTTIAVVDASVFPAAPNIAVIGTGEDAETILYTGISVNDLTGVTRGFQGTAKAWDTGTIISRMFTAYDHDTFKSNIADHGVATTGVHGAGPNHLALFGDASTVVNRIIWKDASEQVRDVLTAYDWTDVDLTASTSANAKFAIILLFLCAADTGTSSDTHLSVRKNGTVPDYFPVVWVGADDPNWHRHIVIAIIGLDAGQVIEARLVLATGATLNTAQINVLGYVE